VPNFLQMYETTRHSENDTYIYKYKTQFCTCKCERLGTALGAVRSAQDYNRTLYFRTECGEIIFCVIPKGYEVPKKGV